MTGPAWSTHVAWILLAQSNHCELLTVSLTRFGQRFVAVSHRNDKKRRLHQQIPMPAFGSDTEMHSSQSTWQGGGVETLEGDEEMGLPMLF
jgi:hypothetical protein